MYAEHITKSYTATNNFNFGCPMKCWLVCSSIWLLFCSDTDGCSAHALSIIMKIMMNFIALKNILQKHLPRDREKRQADKQNREKLKIYNILHGIFLLAWWDYSLLSELIKSPSSDAQKLDILLSLTAATASSQQPTVACFQASLISVICAKLSFDHKSATAQNKNCLGWHWLWQNYQQNMSS